MFGGNFFEDRGYELSRIVFTLCMKSSGERFFQFDSQ